MKKTLELVSIEVKGNRIYYTLINNSGIKLLKTERVKAWIQFDHTDEFDFDLRKLPLSILAIPITLYLLPITWYYDVDLVIPTIDKKLHESLKQIHEAYAKIYGEIPERYLAETGRVYASHVEDNILVLSEKYEKIVFFSGGVDACSAGINNSGKKSVLVSIPSIEAQAKNEGELREEKYRLIKEFSKVSDSPWILIFNNFNEAIFNDNKIQMYLKKFLNSEAFNFDGWFGIKYLANMCSVAPFAYSLGIKELIMGSAFEQLEESKSVNWDGANPELSGSVCFAGIHFGEQDEQYTRRQKKTENIIKWCNQRSQKVKLWTCFSDNSIQCGVCPKCLRTQLNILTVGENPKDWGFELFDEKKFSKLITSFFYWENNACWLWDNIDVIDDSKVYPFCNKMLHWLKKVGYKTYLKKSRAKKRMRNFIKRIIKIHRYPYYIVQILKNIQKKVK